MKNNVNCVFCKDDDCKNPEVKENELRKKCVKYWDSRNFCEYQKKYNCPPSSPPAPPKNISNELKVDFSNLKETLDRLMKREETKDTDNLQKALDFATKIWKEHDLYNLDIPTLAEILEQYRKSFK